MKYKTREELRDFLRLCLDPGPGRDKRTVEYLAEIMPGGVVDLIAEHAPHVAELRTAAADAKTAYTEALRVWIADEVGAAAVAEPKAALPQSGLVGEVVKVPGEFDHWKFRCSKRSGGCGYDSPTLEREEADAKSGLDTHRGHCLAQRAMDSEDGGQ